MATLSEIAEHIKTFQLTPEQKIGMYFRSLGASLEVISKYQDPSKSPAELKTLTEEASVRLMSAFVHAISQIEGYEDVTSVLANPFADNVAITLTGQMTSPAEAGKLMGRMLTVDLDKANTAYFDAIADKNDSAIIFADQILRLFLPEKA